MSGLTGLLSLGKDAATGAIDRGKQAARAAKERVDSRLAQSQQMWENGDYNKVMETVRGFVKDRADIGALHDAGFGEKIGARLIEKKRKAKAELIRMSGSARARLLLAIREQVKSIAVADPDMWNCVKTRIAGGLDLFWDDLTIYVDTAMDDQREATLGRLKADLDALSKLGDPPTCLTPRWFRAFTLYHFLPFDISIFGQFRDPVFWVLTVLTLVPSYGIRVMTFFFIFILIRTGCPPDEFQLVQYILQFKGTQFLSSGVGMAIFAAIKYEICVHPDGTHSCATNGPGATSDVLSGVIDILGSCSLVWAAFFTLPWSQRSAGQREIGAEEDKTVVEANYDRARGGRLAGLLGYDFICFLLSCAFLAGLVYLDVSHLRPGGKDVGDMDEAGLKQEMRSWIFKVNLFWARVFYAFLSFPFVIFMIPGINSILTHTTATGYNRQGVCVPYMLHPVPDDPQE